MVTWNYFPRLNTSEQFKENLAQNCRDVVPQEQSIALLNADRNAVATTQRVFSGPYWAGGCSFPKHCDAKHLGKRLRLATTVIARVPTAYMRAVITLTLTIPISPVRIKNFHSRFFCYTLILHFLFYTIHISDVAHFVKNKTKSVKKKVLYTSRITTCCVGCVCCLCCGSTGSPAHEVALQPGGHCWLVRVFGQMVCVKWHPHKCQDPGFLCRALCCSAVC